MFFADFCQPKNFCCFPDVVHLELSSHPILIHFHSSLENKKMLQDLVSMIVMMLPVFLLLILTFSAGFVVGRISKREQ
jgi:hypothetical protein